MYGGLLGTSSASHPNLYRFPIGSYQVGQVDGYQFTCAIWWHRDKTCKCIHMLLQVLQLKSSYLMVQRSSICCHLAQQRRSTTMHHKYSCHTSHLSCSVRAGWILSGMNTSQTVWRQTLGRSEAKASGDESNHLVPFLETDRPFFAQMRTRWSCLTS